MVKSHMKLEFENKRNGERGKVNRKWIKCALTAAVSVVMLTACGNKYDDTSNDLAQIDVDKYVPTIEYYSNLKIEVDPQDVITDDDVQSYIDYILSSQAELVKSDKTVVEEGDVVNIDYEGIKDGVAFDGGTDTGYDLTIGSGTFIDGFEDGLIGHKVGEEVALDLTFPENYTAEELAGQAVVFNVKINYISEYTKPELTDELVESYELDGVSNVAEYKEFVRNGLQTSADDSFIASKRDALQQALIEQCTFGDISGLGLYQYYVEQIKSQTQAMADTYGVSLEDIVTGLYGMDYDEYEESVAEQAENLVQGALACEKVARNEKISISDKEFDEQIAKDAEEYGYASPEDFKAAIDEDDYRNYLLQMKVVDNLLETAEITENTTEE